MPRKKKNKPMTFAQRAKRIKNKYPRAAWDTIEKNALNKELDALVEEQEAYRTVMGLSETEDKPSIIPNESQMPMPEQFRGGGALGAYFKVRGAPRGYDQYAYGGPEEEVVTQVSEPASVDFQKVTESLRERSPKDIHSYFLGEGADLPIEQKRQIYQGLVQDYPLRLQEQYNPQTGSYSVGFQDMVEGYSKNPQYYGDEDVSTYGVRYGSGFYEPVEMTEFQQRPTGNGDMYRTITDKSPQYSLTPAEYRTTRGFANGGRMYQTGGMEEGLSFQEQLPSFISGAGSVIGNILLASQDREAPRIQPQQVVAEEVDFSPIADTLTRRAETQGRIARTNLRRASRGRGEFLTGATSSSVALQRELGNQLADLQVRQDLTNAEKRQRANELNAAYRSEAQRIDIAREDAREARQRDYLASILETPGAVYRDIRQTAAQKRRDRTIASGRTVLPPEIVEQLLRTYQGR